MFKLSYSELENWYQRIVNLDEVQELLYEHNFSIQIDNSIDAYGMCTNYKDIYINVSIHEDLNNLIDTIAHEISHGKVWAHGKRHDKLTRILAKRIHKLLKSGKSVSNIRTSNTRNTRVVSGYSNQLGNCNNLDDIYGKLSRRV